MKTNAAIKALAEKIKADGWAPEFLGAGFLIGIGGVNGTGELIDRPPAFLRQVMPRPSQIARRYV